VEARGWSGGYRARTGFLEVTPASTAPEPDLPPLYGVDSMVFVYHFEANEEFGPAAGRLLQAAEAGRCRLVCSILTLLEILVVPKRTGQEELCRRYREVFQSFPNLTVLALETHIAEIASDLRARHSVRTPDAIHIATAIRAGAAAFVTGDGRLSRVREIRILRLDEIP
jgi:predicted nucleic acid-binding protein